MAFKFRTAKRGDSAFMLGLAGPSRSGKTYSALRIASGAVGGDASKIFFIDTENKRALQYADRFGAFMHLNLEPPFTSERYSEAIQAAEKADASVIIIDSMSHEHEGAGGMLERHEMETLRRITNPDTGEVNEKRREIVKFGAWAVPKAAHNKFVNDVLRVSANMIFCFRAKDKLQMVKNDRGKIEPVPVGWTPICSSRFEYEMTSMLVLPEGSKGVPDFDALSTGLREPLDQMFIPGAQLSEDLGVLLAEWASGKKVKKAAKKADAPASALDPVVVQNLHLRARDIADTRGTVELEKFFLDLGRDERSAVKADMDKTYKPLAVETDNRIEIAAQNYQAEGQQ